MVSDILAVYFLVLVLPQPRLCSYAALFQEWTRVVLLQRQGPIIGVEMLGRENCFCVIEIAMVVAVLVVRV